jgi:hypothetical protein
MKSFGKLLAGCEKQTDSSSRRVLEWASIQAFLTFVVGKASGAPIPRFGTTAYRSKTWQTLRDLQSIRSLRGASTDTG